MRRVILYLNPFKKIKCRSVKNEIFGLYSDASMLTRLYIRMRWHLFNKFEELEALIPDSGKILDLGCGYGIFTSLLALNSKKREIVGLDCLKARIKIAQKTQDKTSMKIKYYSGDIIDFEFEKFNAITLIDMLYYLQFDSQIRLMHTCYEALEEGGILLIKDFNRRPFWKFYLFYIQEILAVFTRIFFGNQAWKNVFKGKFFVRNSADMTSLLKGAGFMVEDSRFDKGNYQSHYLYVCRK